MCNIGQLAAWQTGILSAMDEEIERLKDGLIVTFSDGTIGGYAVEELLLLRPTRERVKELVDSN